MSDVELGAQGRLCGRRRSAPGPAAAAAWHDAWCANLLPPANLAMTCCRGSAAVLPAALPKPQMPCMRANLPACSPPFCRRHQCVPDCLLDWALAAHLPLVRGNCLLGRRAIQQHFCLAGRARGSALSFPAALFPSHRRTPLQPATPNAEPSNPAPGWPQVLAVQGHCAVHAALLHLRQAGHALHVSSSWFAGCGLRLERHAVIMPQCTVSGPYFLRLPCNPTTPVPPGCLSTAMPPTRCPCTTCSSRRRAPCCAR